MSGGTLYLIPALLGGDDPRVLPAATLERIRALDTFVVENAKSARRFLKLAGVERVGEATLALLNVDTPDDALPALLAPVVAGRDAGLLSEAGCPAVADPGAGLVRLAHGKGLRVVPLVGPSSILLALMASGLNGQRFSFHGYLPIPDPERRRAIGALEAASRRERSTQIFIEAPHRNRALLDALAETCRGDTLLCLATGLTLPDQRVATKTVEDWKRALPDLHRQPTVFLLLAALPTRR